MSVRSNNDFPGIVVGVGATISQNSGDQVNSYGLGVKAFVNVTAIGTGSITVTIQGKDPTSGVYYTVLASAAIVVNGLVVLSVYPALTATANLVANDVLPRVWRVLVTANNANPASYTVGASVIV